MQQTPCEASRFATSQDIPGIIQNPKVRLPCLKEVATCPCPKPD